MTASPLAVGSRRQLFIDDHVIAQSRNLKRSFHTARRHGPPVLEPEHPWEGVGTSPWPSTYLFGDVIHDAERGCYRMWYTTAKADMRGGQHDVLYAESTDGINWHKPLDLNLIRYEGRGTNILVQNLSPLSVLERRDAADPAQRYQLLTYDRNVHGYAWRYSPDGLLWSEPRLVPALQGEGMSDNLNVAYDDTRGHYVIAVKKFDASYVHPVLGRLPGPGFRRWFMTTSPDGMACSPLVEMPDLIDALDKRLYMDGERCGSLNTYGISLFAYHGVYIGIQWFFRVTDSAGFYACHGGCMDGRLLFSRDPGAQWQIPARQFVIARGERGDWDWGMLCGIANRPVLSPNGREWWYYYGGWEYGHGISQRRGCVGLARLRVDGFASIGSPDTEGDLRTPTLTFSGRRLSVNVDAAGTDTEGRRNFLRSELLDETGAVISGFSRDDCDPIHADAVDATVTWRGRSDIGALAGRPVAVRFILKSAELYAFQFLP